MSEELRPLGEQGQRPDAAERVDALFAGPSGAEAAPRADRSGRILLLLLVAAPLNLVGLVTCTSVPGALLTLWAWTLARRDMELMEDGALPVTETVRLARLKLAATVMLVFCSLVLLLQVGLLASGFYERLLLRWDLVLGG